MKGVRRQEKGEEWGGIGGNEGGKSEREGIREDKQEGEKGQ